MIRKKLFKGTVTAWIKACDTLVLMEEEEEKTLCGICGLLELEHRNDERHSFISYADMEKARMDYYDRKTAHREEMLRPLAWLALVTFFLMVFGSIARMLGFPI